MHGDAKTLIKISLSSRKIIFCITGRVIWVAIEWNIVHLRDDFPTLQEMISFIPHTSLHKANHIQVPGVSINTRRALKFPCKGIAGESIIVSLGKDMPGLNGCTQTAQLLDSKSCLYIVQAEIPPEVDLFVVPRSFLAMLSITGDAV